MKKMTVHTGVTLHQIGMAGILRDNVTNLYKTEQERLHNIVHINHDPAAHDAKVRSSHGDQINTFRNKYDRMFEAPGNKLTKEQIYSAYDSEAQSLFHTIISRQTPELQEILNGLSNEMTRKLDRQKLLRETRNEEEREIRKKEERIARQNYAMQEMLDNIAFLDAFLQVSSTLPRPLTVENVESAKPAFDHRYLQLKQDALQQEQERRDEQESQRAQAREAQKLQREENRRTREQERRARILRAYQELQLQEAERAEEFRMNAEREQAARRARVASDARGGRGGRGGRR
jgi:hypothetical protein